MFKAIQVNNFIFEMKTCDKQHISPGVHGYGLLIPTPPILSGIFHHKTCSDQYRPSQKINNKNHKALLNICITEISKNKNNISQQPITWIKQLPY